MAVLGYRPRVAIQITLADSAANMIKMHGAKPAAKEA